TRCDELARLDRLRGVSIAGIAAVDVEQAVVVHGDPHGSQGPPSLCGFEAPIDPGVSTTSVHAERPGWPAGPLPVPRVYCLPMSSSASIRAEIASSTAASASSIAPYA